MYDGLIMRSDIMLTEAKQTTICCRNSVQIDC